MGWIEIVFFRIIGTTVESSAALRLAWYGISKSQRKCRMLSGRIQSWALGEGVYCLFMWEVSLHQIVNNIDEVTLGPPMDAMTKFSSFSCAPKCIIKKRWGTQKIETLESITQNGNIFLKDDLNLMRKQVLAGRCQISNTSN